MTIEERTSAILDKIMEVASAADNEDRIVMLEENYTMLMECILEMSEIIYA